jgi:hypothetical protein
MCNFNLSSPALYALLVQSANPAQQLQHKTSPPVLRSATSMRIVVPASGLINGMLGQI